MHVWNVLHNVGAMCLDSNGAAATAGFGFQGAILVGWHAASIPHTMRECGAGTHRSSSRTNDGRGPLLVVLTALW